MRRLSADLDLELAARGAHGVAGALAVQQRELGRREISADPWGIFEIPGHKNLSFIPTNRAAIVHLPPIANRSTPTQAFINLHAWFEEDISHTAGDSQASRSSIIFGPSISIGNIGTNL